MYKVQLSPPTTNSVLAEQTRIMHRQVPSSLLGGITAATIIVLICWNSVNNLLMLCWYLTAIAASGLRYLHYRNIDLAKQEDALIIKWLKVTRLLLLLSSIVWGTGLWVLYTPDNIQVTLILLLFICVLVSGSIGPLSSDFSAYLYYTVPMVVIIFAKLQFTASIYGHILPFTLPLFLVINLLYVKNLQSNYIDKIKLQFENTDLVSLLKKQQIELIKKHKLAQQSKEIAIDANKRKSQFIAAASHDLSQPLYSIGLFLSAMEDENDDQIQKEYIAKSNACVENMSSLFSSLMDISKFDSGNMNAETKTVNILNILDPISTEFELPIKSKNLEFICEIESAMVNTDSILLQRIVRNLLNNALSYTKTGKIGLVTKTVANNKLKIEIFDTGLGIPEKELDNIFDEFYQLKNPHRDNRKGRGIGLSIVKRMTDLLELELKISSTVGEGSCFSLEVPYA